MIRANFVTQCIRKFSSNIFKEMKYLNVAEKNDAAKTISGFLSNGASRRREGFSVYNKIYEFEANVRGVQAKMTMTSVSGHLLSYEFVASYRNWKTCDPQQLFDAPVRKSCPQDYEAIKRTLEREIRSCHGLIVWTDCDREGENIGFEVVEVCKAIKPNIPVYRAKFSEITAVAVRRALANLVQPDKRQSEAVDTRQELDLRIGAAFTRFQTLRLRRIFPSQIAEKLISYGSCQIPTLGFVAQRYKEAEDFVSEPFWKLKVTHTIDELTVEFIWARNRLFDQEECEDYLMLCLADPIANVESVVTKPKNKWRPNPMDTVQLEKLGSRKLKINAKTVMSIAEKLYQQGYISYPRTETNCFSNEIDLRSLVEHHTPHPDWGQFASRVLEWGPNPRNGQKSDQAHPPIHPIKFTTGLSGDEKRVYELVVRHFLACVSKDATGSETVVNITIAGEKFTATGLCIYERNYLDVYPYEKWNAKQIHRYETGSTFEPTDISMQEGATTAPPLLTEADLIALMEKHGIGTDATHAEHIHTIKERGYIGEVDRGFLVPGTIGMGLYEGYHAMELPLAEPVLRAEFEVDLKRICSGERNPKDVLREQIQKYKEAYRIIIEKAQALDEHLARRLNETPQQNTSEETLPIVRLEEVLPCPKCSNSLMALKQKRDSTSSFLSCVSYPDCRNAVWFSDDIKSIKVTEATCSKCGPGYRIIKLKFKQMSYLAMLNASDSTYSTCIACDRKFQEIFDINVDSVRKVGAIVSDRNNTVATNRNINNVLGRGADHTGPNRNSASNRNTGANRAPSNSRSNSTTARNHSSDGGIVSNRNNSAATNRNVNNILRRTANSNAGREPSNSRTIAGRAPLNSRSNSTTTINQSNGISQYQGWGRIESNSEPQPNSVPRVNSIAQPIRTAITDGRVQLSTGHFDAFDDDFDDVLLNNDWDFNVNANNSNNNTNNTRNQEAMSWGTSGSSVQLSGTAITQHRSQNENNEQNMVKCTACNQVARSLIAKNDGPNKDRPFYSCSTSCNFFLWADQPARTSTNTNTGSSNVNSGGWANVRPDNSRSSNDNSDNTNVNRGWANIRPDNSRLSNDNSANTYVNRGGWANFRPDNFPSTSDNSGNTNVNRGGWANIRPDNIRSNNDVSNNSGAVMCACNKPAKELTVRKDGPNKGRQFFACKKEETSCTFFKWREENTSPNVGSAGGSNNAGMSSWGTGTNSRNNRDQQPTTSWGTNSRSNSSAIASSSNNNAAKKRKCGLCRQEGHTKLKCPRKDEFEGY